ncbi:MAG: DNA polymerase III subunit gamma/tau [Acidocella sp. 20-57-95]|nr:MAG: DNA polymerase III subunit gamma/tau [Acidocella sp. 20-57-95]OYV60245.1 MAG: DNA polymerase III subunit gamma/tau [Acidocella sp. 21-58-7]HQT63460.1 DNA polymerase III subunit gamma/tau [Acidocella sp.]HQU04846.1 DNA polymerase III subunit gamma/tau [Acidocella sp.]
MAGLFEDEAPPPAFSGPSLFGDEPEVTPQAAAYRVLARKYRPTTFDDLIGQDGLVRTLRNAFAMNRIAHAFMLTGVRGVGKTTTARILARALNCTGPDDQGGPTPDPCGVCANCVAILADRHPDVVEMDAASNTGVDDVREIIEATRFKPLSARIKVFIIDEVHMLSRNAFNALLKTLEEPPPHVKFVFATTEIRKVPVTVLSRCQRFDLRRVAVAELSAHFARIAKLENIAIAAEALDHIARAADGSVRDGLSLLDQAIARGSEDGTEITAEMVAEMLGLADRGYVFDLMEAVMAGDAAAALAVTDIAHARGADLGVLIADLLGLAHLLTRLKSVPALATSNALPEAERTRGLALASSLSVPWLGRLWQMLLKGVAEVEAAPDRRAAAEMIIIRLCYVADMPPPADLIKKLEQQVANNQNGGGMPGGNNGGTRAVANGAPAQAIAAPRAITFQDVVALASSKRDVMLYAHLRQSVHIVRFAPPVIEMRIDPDAPRDLAQRLSALLEAETNRRWTIVISQAPGAPTIAQTERQAENNAFQDALSHPLVQAILSEFPGARIEALHTAPEAIVEELPPDWTELSPPDTAYIEEDDDR